jgi:hypothetical protein
MVVRSGEEDAWLPHTFLPRATHFVTHAYTDYSLVNKWWHYGHEIASHSIS